MNGLRHHRGYVLLAVTTIGVALGATVTVFAILNALFFRPIPVGDPDRVVVPIRSFLTLDPGSWTDRGLTLLRSFDLFDTVAGQVTARDRNAQLQPRIVLRHDARAVSAVAVTAEYFSALQVPLAGRSFTGSEDSGGQPVAIISHRLWQSRLQGSPDTLGSLVDAAPEPLTIVGIAPPGFHGALRGEAIDMWVPHGILPRWAGLSNINTDLPMIAIGRLRPNVSVSAASNWFQQSEVRTRRDIDVVPINRLFADVDVPMSVINESSFMSLVFAASLLVLLSGCATLMALIHVHYERRRKELAVKVALGASPSRLCTELITELGVVGLLGTAVAACAAAVGMRVMPAFHLGGSLTLARLSLTVDWRVVTAAFAVCAASMAIAAAWPLGRVFRTLRVVRLSSMNAVDGRGVRWSRWLVQVAHAALATVVLVTAGLFVRTVSFGMTEGAAFDPDRTLFAKVRFRTVGDDDLDKEAARNTAGVDRVMSRLRELPGVEEVAIGGAPLRPGFDYLLSRESKVVTDVGTDALPIAWMSVGPGYLEVLGIQLRQGRAGTGAEGVISVSLAEKLWPDESPLGRPLSYGSFRGTVVGVVDMPFISLKLGRPFGLLSFEFEQERMLHATIRSNREAQLTIRCSPMMRRAVANVLREELPDEPLLTVTSGRELIEADIGRERMAAWFFSCFGLISIALGAGGLFALVSYIIDANRRAFGIMMAIGAPTNLIIRQTIAAALWPVALGSVLGGALSLAAGKVVQAYLLGVTDGDARTYAATFALMLLSSAAAGFAAAWRVRQIMPSEVLRAE